MRDDALLLAAIIAAPAEDTPRLAYADWLDEHRQPDRAELIRVQCHPLVRDLEPLYVSAPPTHRCATCGALWVYTPPDPAAPAYHPFRNGSWSLGSLRCGACCDNAPMGDQIVPLGGEQIALLYRARALVDVTGAGVADFGFKVTYRRGFVSRIACQWRRWRAHGPGYARANPIDEALLTDVIMWYGPGEDFFLVDPDAPEAADPYRVHVNEPGDAVVFDFMWRTGRGARHVGGSALSAAWIAPRARVLAWRTEAAHRADVSAALLATARRVPDA